MTCFRILFSILLIYSNGLSFANTTIENPSTPLKLAYKICVLDCEIYEAETPIIIAKAKGFDLSEFEVYTKIRDSLYAEYDALVEPFTIATHQSWNAIFSEVREWSWFIVIQYYLRKNGVALSANERFDLVKDLPESGGNSYDFRTSNSARSQIRHYIYAATEVILNDYFPNWRQATYKQILRLTTGVNAFVKISRNYFVPFTFQTGDMNCGPTSLKIVCDQMGVYHSIDTLSRLSNLDETGTSFGDLIQAATSLKLETENYKASYEELLQELNYPVIAHWQNRHFVVVYAGNLDSVWLADPEWGRISFTREEFCDNWLYGTEKTNQKGSILTFEPKPSFYRDNALGFFFN